MDARDGGRMLG